MPLDVPPDFSQVQFPKKLQFLFKPSRFKVMYGGRGGSKSWGIGRALLILGAQGRSDIGEDGKQKRDEQGRPMVRGLRILCAREFQNSLTESVHQLLENQIKLLGLEHLYEVQKAKIIGPNGTEFVFAGIRNNINNMKSFEGCDICWVEEAVNVSKRSWDVLIPTIRKDASEIWISFNPELESDETYKRFVLNPEPDSQVVKIGWRDNPWFNDVLRKAKDALRERDPVAYTHVYEGNCTQTLDGAIYAKELLATLNDGRRLRVPHDPSKPVFTYWDLGRSDMTAIWFLQLVGYDRRVIDYYSATGHTAEHYVSVMKGQFIDENGQNIGPHRAKYNYDTHVLPHDGAHKTILHPLSFKGQLQALMPTSRVITLLPTSIEDGINAARTIFPTCVFDEEKTADGWQCLAHYQYEEDDDGSRSKKPLHNWASHGADAFRTMAMGLRERKPPIADKLRQPAPPLVSAGASSRNKGWMRR